MLTKGVTAIEEGLDILGIGVKCPTERMIEMREDGNFYRFIGNLVIVQLDGIAVGMAHFVSTQGRLRDQALKLGVITVEKCRKTAFKIAIRKSAQGVAFCLNDALAKR